MIELPNNLVKLPEVSSAAFEIVLDCVYGRFHKNPKNYVVNNKMELPVDTWVLANKLCMEQACNDILDAMK
jgi:hypothetical protein